MNETTIHLLASAICPEDPDGLIQLIQLVARQTAIDDRVRAEGVGWTLGPRTHHLIPLGEATETK